MDPPQRPASTVRGGGESEQTGFQLREGTQYFFRMRFLFLSCRLIQCITASVILFFPRAAFSHLPGVTYELMVVSDPGLLTHYGFNLGIAGAALLQNFICYVVYFVDKALLPFIIYTAAIDFMLSIGYLGLLLTSILMGGVGLGLFYKALCILAWLAFLITSIMEVSLVCIFNYLRNELRARIAMQQDLGEEAAGMPIQRPLAVAIKEKTPHVRRVRRNATVESVEDSTDLARNPDNQDMEGLSSITLIRRQDPTQLSQATTIAEILQEPVNRLHNT